MSNDTDREFEAANKLAEYRFDPPSKLKHVEPGNVIEIAYEGENEPITAIVLDYHFQTNADKGMQEFMLQLMRRRPDDHRLTATKFDARTDQWSQIELRSADPDGDDRDYSGILAGRPNVLADTPGEYEAIEEEFEEIEFEEPDPDEPIDVSGGTIEEDSDE